MNTTFSLLYKEYGFDVTDEAVSEMKRRIRQDMIKWFQMGNRIKNWGLYRMHALGYFVTGQMQEKGCFMLIDGKWLRMCEKHGFMP